MALKRSSLKKKAISLAKAQVRTLGFCEWCGKTKMEAQMQGSHIFPEEYVATAADTDNILCLCASCHKWKKSGWHKSPLEAAAWFHSKYPGRYDRLYQKAHSGVIPDWTFICMQFGGPRG